ncbi:Elongation factor 1-alpha [Cardamine amara subsp. amara]|uniref:Elongation factor 1-alpha n=1 Tax=Cardamine amara subsp. amara TaxID=228776 RepID=A0ABD1C530_CARAN
MDKRMCQNVCPWWSGPSFFEVLDSIEITPHDPNGPFRMPILNKFKDMGTFVMGKVEYGSIHEGDSLVVMPNKKHVKVVDIYCNEVQVKRAGPGENVRVGIIGIEDKDIFSGSVLSSNTVKPVPVVTEFVAQLQILELHGDHPILAAGYIDVRLHIHAAVEDCEIMELISQIDVKTGEVMRKKVVYVKNGDAVVCRIQVGNPICIERFSDFPQLGRFALRTGGKTIAVGIVTDLSGAASSA